MSPVIAITTAATSQTIRNNVTINHQHYKAFSLHPGITTLIACVVIAVLILGYMWAENMWNFYLLVRRNSPCCFSTGSTPKKSQSKEEVEMVSLKSQCSSTDEGSSISDENDTTTDNECQSQEIDNFLSEDKIEKAKQKIQSASHLQSFTCPVLLASIIVEGFPNSPAILLTPATPLPSVHSSLAKLDSPSSHRILLDESRISSDEERFNRSE